MPSQTWVSYSSISDYLRCPRAYFLKNIYKNQENRKIALIQPSLALGQAVHAVLEELSNLPIADRFSTPVQAQYNLIWPNYSGKKGGFLDAVQEADYKARGAEMLHRLEENPCPLLNKAVRIPKEGMLLDGLPSYGLTADIVLCGQVDWLEYIETTNSVHIIDFKTGKSEEKKGSLQLPIYLLLVSHCQARPVSKMSYWYLERDIAPTPMDMPDPDAAEKEVLSIAKDIVWAREQRRFPCGQGNGCRDCEPYEAIINGQAEWVYTDHNTRKDIYILSSELDHEVI